MSSQLSSRQRRGSFVVPDEETTETVDQMMDQIIAKGFRKRAPPSEGIES